MANGGEDMKADLMANGMGDTGADRAQADRAQFDVFISYRRSDASLVALWLRRALSRYRLPSELDPHARRRLAVFRYEIYRRPTPDFFQDFIVPNLERSSSLLVIVTRDALAPSEASKPNWVDREIETFVGLPGPRRVFIARVDGELGGPLPSALHDRFPRVDEIDLRRLRPSRLRARVTARPPRLELLSLIAALLEVPTEQMPILMREEQRLRRAARTRIAIVAAVLGLVLLGAFGYARLQAVEASRARDRERDERLIAAALSQPNPTRTALLREVRSHDRVWRHLAFSALAEGPFAELELRGHAAEVSWAAFSPDGSRIVSASHDGTIRAWSADLGVPLGTPLRPSRSARMHSVGYRPDGAALVIASDDGTEQWSGDLSRSLGARCGTGPCYAARFDPAGRQVVAACARGAYVCRPDGDPIELLVGARVNHAAFSPDGDRIVLAASTGVFVSAASGGAARQLSPDEAAYAEFSHDGQHLLAMLTGGTVLRWTADGQPVGAPIHHGPRAGNAIFSADDKRIYTAGHDREVRVWGIDGDARGVIEQASPVCFVSPSADGRRLLTAQHVDGVVRVWNLDDHTWPVPQADGDSVAINDDGSRLMTTWFGSLTIWQLDGGRLRRLATVAELNAEVAAFDHGGTRIAVGSKDDAAYTYRLEPEGLRDGMRYPHAGSVEVVQFSPDNARLLTSTSTSASLWQVNGPQIELPKELVPLLFASFDARGSQLLAIGDGKPYLWDMRPGIRPVLLANEDPMYAAAISADGLRVAVGGSSGRVRVMRTDGHPLDVPTMTLTSPVTALAFSAHGDLAIGSYDGQVRRWDAAGRRTGMTALSQTGAVGGLAFSPDGSRIVGTSLFLELSEPEPDIRAMVWESDGTPCSELSLATEPGLRQAVFSADGSRLAVVYKSTNVRIWPTDPAAALWRATPYCVSAADRVRLLAEPEAEAARRYAACVDRFASPGAGAP